MPTRRSRDDELLWDPALVLSTAAVASLVAPISLSYLSLVVPLYVVGFVSIRGLKFLAIDGRGGLAGLVLLAGAMMFLFSFGGLRPVGGAIACVGFGGCAGLVLDAYLPGCVVVHRRPREVAYFVVVIALPVVLASMFALLSHDPGSQSTGLVWEFTAAYVAGLLFWMLLRARLEEPAFFAAAGLAFWGVVLFMVPLALPVGVAALGGVAATAPYLWRPDSNGG